MSARSPLSGSDTALLKTWPPSLLLASEKRGITTLFIHPMVFSRAVDMLRAPEVVTWDDDTGSMVPFGSNRTWARKEAEDGGTGRLLA